MAYIPSSFFIRATGSDTDFRRIRRPSKHQFHVVYPEFVPYSPAEGFAVT